MSALGIGPSLTVRQRRPAPAPSDLGAALLGLWTADSGVTVATGVSAWTDRIVGYVLTQATGALQPAWSATSFGGRPGITFDGVDDFLNLEAVPFPNGAAPCEIWALADFSSVDAVARTIACYGGATSQTARTLRRNSGLIGTNLIGTGASNVSAQTLQTLSGRHVLRAIVSATAGSIQVDGGDIPAPIAAIPATGTTRFRVGGSTVAVPNNLWQGSIAAIGVTALLSDVQAAGFTSYLRALGNVA